MAAQADKIITFVVFVGFAMFALLNAGNVVQLLQGSGSAISSTIGGIARA